eukprot:1161911-Pelagomonas_calceolata.AAC.2
MAGVPINDEVPVRSVGKQACAVAQQGPICSRKELSQGCAQGLLICSCHCSAMKRETTHGNLTRVACQQGGNQLLWASWQKKMQATTPSNLLAYKEVGAKCSLMDLRRAFSLAAIMDLQMG